MFYYLFSAPAALVLGGTTQSTSHLLVDLGRTGSDLCGESVPDLSSTYTYQSAGTVTKEGTIVTCGSAKSANSVKCWYLGRGAGHTWSQGPSLPSKRYQGQLESIGNYIYFFGGYYGSAYYKDIYELNDDLKGSWSHVDNMKDKRAWFCSVTTKDSIIMIGL